MASGLRVCLRQLRHRAAGTLRDDVRIENIVAAIVGMFAATSRVGGNEQLKRMFDLLTDAGGALESPIRVGLPRGPGPVARDSVLLAGRLVREVGGYPGLVQVVGLTARLGGRDRALVIRESEMS
jgi:hypothetical protein